MSYNLSGLIEINSCKNFQSYIKKIYEFPILSEEEELQYALKWSQDKDKQSAQMLITSHLKLVVKIAMLYKYRGCSLPIIDLISEGALGLIESLKNFDIQKKCRLATYAIFYIKAKINDFIMNSFSLIKLSTAKVTKKLFLKFKEIANSVTDSDLEKIANETGIPIKNVSEMKSRILSREISIDSNPYYNNSSSFFDDSQNNNLDKKIKSDLPTPEEFVLNSDDRKKKLSEIAYACMNILDSQEKDIIANRIISNNPLTLKELSAKYNISQERIRQKQEIALNKIRKHLEQKKLFNFKINNKKHNMIN
jgi:RNA polymerase sigma-32 factor